MVEACGSFLGGDVERTPKDLIGGSFQGGNPGRTTRDLMVLACGSFLGGDVERTTRDVVISPLDDKQVVATILDEVSHHVDVAAGAGSSSSSCRVLGCYLILHFVRTMWYSTSLLFVVVMVLFVFE